MPPPRFNPRLSTSPRLSHKSALVLLPPAVVQAPIDAVRRIHDKNFARWPPHINLIYPFLNMPSFQGEGSALPQLREEIRSRVRNVIRHVEPFHMTLVTGEPEAFIHGKNSRTVWLRPSSDAVSRLQAALQAEFAECDHDQRAYVPHLSLGQAKSDAQQMQVCELLNKEVSQHLISNELHQLDWRVDEIHVIERKHYKDRFKIVGSIKLGDAD